MAITSLWAETRAAGDIVKIDLATGDVDEESRISREDFAGEEVLELNFRPLMKAGEASYSLWVGSGTTYGKVSFGGVAAQDSSGGIDVSPYASVDGVADVNAARHWSFDASKVVSEAELGGDSFLLGLSGDPLAVQSATAYTGSYIKYFLTPAGDAIVYSVRDSTSWNCVELPSGALRWSVPVSTFDDRFQNRQYAVVGLPGSEELVARNDSDRGKLDVVNLATGALTTISPTGSEWDSWEFGAQWIGRNPLTGDALIVASGRLILLSPDYGAENVNEPFSYPSVVQFDEGSNKWYIVADSSATSGQSIYVYEADLQSYVETPVSDVQSGIAFTGPFVAPSSPPYWQAFLRSKEVV
jgi:hypothetical protein